MNYTYHTTKSNNLIKYRFLKNCLKPFSSKFRFEAEIKKLAAAIHVNTNRHEHRHTKTKITNLPVNKANKLGFRSQKFLRRKK